MKIKVKDGTKSVVLSKPDYAVLDKAIELAANITLACGNQKVLAAGREADHALANLLAVLPHPSPASEEDDGE